MLDKVRSKRKNGEHNAEGFCLAIWDADEKRNALPPSLLDRNMTGTKSRYGYQG